MKLKSLTILAAAAAAAVASCSKPEPKADYDLTLNMEELMGHVIDHGAWTFWRASGEVITEKGTESLTPKTQEGWDAAESGVATVAEAGNLLLMPGRMMDDSDWPKFAKAMTKAALDGRAAAIAKDEAKMFQTGGELYETCVACHAKYVIPQAIAANVEIIDKARLTDFSAEDKARIQAYERAHPR